MAKTPFISICIPAYGMGGDGARFLAHSFDILAQQDFKDFEVVVADQSDDEAVADLCKARDDLTIRHIWTRDLARQNSTNSNAAMDAATGEVIKILFQDDFLLGTDALGPLAQAFDHPSVNWALTGCEHSPDGETLTRPFIPHVHDRMQWGRNTVSSPSVLSVRRKLAPRFDEELIWLMDGDYYHRCLLELGEPVILHDPMVVNRVHPGQLSARIKGSLKRKEFRYIRDKYRDTMTWGEWWHYMGQMRRSFI